MSKRKLIHIGTDKHGERTNEESTFNLSVNVGQFPSSDRYKVKNVARPGSGYQSDHRSP
ncbi:hypothetical protein ABIC60_003612 [Phyllobacterium ifriqiyense]